MSIIKNDFEKMNITKIKNSKNNKKLTMITAYDALFAKLFEDIADMILVGDSLNMSFAGKPDTLSATLEQMIYHTNAVCAGASKAFVILDMPFGTYINKDDALKNAIEAMMVNKMFFVFIVCFRVGFKLVFNSWNKESDVLSDCLCCFIRV
jgi:3-methyl-2-oxobutanoate hydroxymethyltransferase